MSLKITLKPSERVIIGGAVVTNGRQRCDLFIENNVPVLRQKDILGEKDAGTPCKRIYFVIQLMYIDEHNVDKHHETYWNLINELLKAAPSMLTKIDQISVHILQRKYYKALKLTKKLIEYEQEVMNHAR